MEISQVERYPAGESPFEKLSDEILIRIMGLLGPPDLARLCRTSKRIAGIAKDPRLWTRRVLELKPPLLSPLGDRDPVQLYGSLASSTQWLANPELRVQHTTLHIQRPIWGGALLRARLYEQDGAIRVLANWGGTGLWIVDLKTGRYAKRILDGKPLIFGEKIFRSGNELCTLVRSDGIPRIFDLRSGEHRHSLAVGQARIWDAKIFYVGKEARVVSRSDSKKPLCIWNPETGECLRELTGGSRSSYGLKVFDYRGASHALSWSKSHKLQIWNLETGKLVHLCTVPLQPQYRNGHRFDRIEYAKIFYDGDTILALTWSSDGRLRVSSFETGECLIELQLASQPSLFYEEGRARALTLSEWGLFQIWDLVTGGCLREFKTGLGDCAGKKIMNRGGKAWMLEWSEEGVLQVWDLATGKCLRRHEPNLECEVPKDIVQVHLSGDDQVRVLGWSLGGQISIWEAVPDSPLPAASQSSLSVPQRRHTAAVALVVMVLAMGLIATWRRLKFSAQPVHSSNLM